MVMNSSDLKPITEQSLRHFADTYREAEGAPGSVCVPGSYVFLGLKLKTLYSISKTLGLLRRVEVVIGFNHQLAFGALGHQVRPDEGINVAIEDAVHIANAEFRAVVLDQAIGLHDVRADLAAEGNIQLGFVEAVGFVAALLQLQIVKFRAQHLHGHFAVLVLAAAHLAGDDDAGGKMREANRGLDFIDVLPALAAGTKRIKLDVFGLDVHFNAVVNFGNDKNGCERSVSPRRLIKG